MRSLTRTLGVGLVAGAVGTAAMALSQFVEERLRDREASPMPAQAAEKLLDLEPQSEAAEKRLSTLVHWAYGTLWGVPRAVLGLLGVPGPAATATHFGAVTAAGMAMPPALDLAPPPWRWGATEVSVDTLHHAIYAGAVGLVCRALGR